MKFDTEYDQLVERLKHGARLVNTRKARKTLGAQALSPSQRKQIRREFADVPQSNRQRELFLKHQIEKYGVSRRYIVSIIEEA